MGEIHPVQTLKATPFLFGIVAPTGDNETNFLERVDLIMLMG